MIIAPEVQALRSNDAPQRQTQREMLDLVKTWFASPAVAEIENQFLRYADGEPLARLPALAQLFTAGSDGGGDLVRGLVQQVLAFLADQPLGQIPFRHRMDDHSALMVLCSRGGAALAVQLIDGPALARRLPAQSVTFTPGETHDVILAGVASTRMVTLERELPGRAELNVRVETIAVGDVACRDGARECQIVEAVKGSLVSLKLQRRSQTDSLTREFALDDGRFLRQAAATPRETRLELMAALLGRMGRSDAAPLLAAMAQEEAGSSLRWQSLKECLALDTATGFSVLCAIAEDARDPLAGPAGALRAQLLETYPALQGINQCPA